MKFCMYKRFHKQTCNVKALGVNPGVIYHSRAWGWLVMVVLKQRWRVNVTASRRTFASAESSKVQWCQGSGKTGIIDTSRVLLCLSVMQKLEKSLFCPLLEGLKPLLLLTTPLQFYLMEFAVVELAFITILCIVYLIIQLIGFSVVLSLNQNCNLGFLFGIPILNRVRVKLSEFTTVSQDGFWETMQSLD